MKNALLTGISGGIGSEIARRLVAGGYTVHGTYNSKAREAEEIKNGLGNVVLYQIDFRERSQTLKLLEKLKLVKFDAIINNAGVFLDDPLANTDLKAWDETLEINLTVPAMIIRYLANNLVEGASIVNICSIYGTRVMANDSLAYTASKAGLTALTKALSVSFAGRKIRVNGVAPGPVDTPINSGMSKESKEEIINQTPLREYCPPSYIADIVEFLLDAKSHWINGEVIVTDGGQTNLHSFFSV